MSFLYSLVLYRLGRESWLQYFNPIPSVAWLIVFVPLLTMPNNGLQCVILTFLGHSHVPLFSSIQSYLLDTFKSYFSIKITLKLHFYSVFIFSAIGNNCTHDDDCTGEGFVCNTGICECGDGYFQSGISECSEGMLQVLMCII